MDKVLVRQHGRVQIVSINRPEARNAVDNETSAALVAAFENFDRNASLDVAVFTGEGGTFCAGADLKAFANGRGNRLSESGPGPMGPTRMLLTKPVIAAVEGHAVAGGLELAIWCDLRVAAKNAIFGVYCRRFGVPLIDGGTVRLPRLIGHSNALDLILTGRGVSGEEAFRMGLANRLVEHGAALESAIHLAQEIADFPPNCMRSDRLSAYEQWSLSVPDGIQNEFRRGISILSSGESSEGALRFSAGEGRHGDKIRSHSDSVI